jgi:hypothetical protein
LEAREWPTGPVRSAAFRKERARFAGAAIAAALAFCSAEALASPQALGGTMSGTQETPPNTTTATGSCVASVDETTLLVAFSGTFTGLEAQATSASLRGPAAPGAVGPVLLTQTTIAAASSGTFSGSGTLTDVQVANLLAGETYCEIDDGAFPSGEIRGRLTVLPAAPALGRWEVAWLAVLLAGMAIAARGHVGSPHPGPSADPRSGA